MCAPIALLLLNDSRTDRTAKAVGSKNLGFGYALSDMRISQNEWPCGKTITFSR